MEFKLSEILAATGAVPLGDWDPEAVTVTAFETDSRNCGPGSLFVPIRGERVDGHDFIPKAFENGAAASFTDRRMENPAGPLLLVPDPRAALQQFAAAYRGRFRLPIVGITGSVGKTTAKEMVAQALSAGFNVYKTPGNQNSQVGVPITVCGLEAAHTAAVIEMGVSMPGEMARIAAVVKPTCAVMTMIGVSHIEYMKTRENILAEKAHIADDLPEDGILFVNGDDDLLPSLKETAPHTVQTFGLDPRCDWRAVSLNETAQGTAFTCLAPDGEETEVFVPAAGEHNVRNALAALAVARTLGVPAGDAAQALRAYKAPPKRQEITEVNGLILIDDSYNASPDSMRAALNVLRAQQIPGKRAAVLADMLELGEFARKGHFETGRYAREQGVDLLVAVGPLAREIANGYGPGAAWFATNQEAVEYLRQRLAPGDAVLVKGSHGMRTDEIAAALKREKLDPK